MDMIVQKANQVSKLSKAIAEYTVKGEREKFISALSEFILVKAEIKKSFLTTDIVRISDKELAAVIQAISQGELLPIEKALSGVPSELFRIELSDEEIEKYAKELFLTWFSQYDYVNALFKTGALILSIGELPKFLDKYVNEVRQSYVFQNYLAACVMCRTIVEICVKDIAVKRGLLKMPEQRAKINSNKLILADFNDFNLDKMIDKISTDEINKSLHRARKKANKIVHGSTLATSDETLKIMKETFKAIHELYVYHGSLSDKQ